MLKDGFGELPVLLALLSAGGFSSGESSLPDAIRTTAATAPTTAITARRMKSGFRRRPGPSGPPPPSGGCDGGQPPYEGGPLSPGGGP